MDAKKVKQLLDEVTVWVLSQSAPEFSRADNPEQREAAQAVWRRHRDSVLGHLDEIETGLGLGLI